ncbi:hypothetical protein NDU88_001963 [Pleurodeles waltl]|uniref:Uncharacterized protein n=1 Tax=Pleurodeles waltl TaxID=8319 RepID=A0AAV7LCI9_PLEWA|nr:hypothetical protein NDU88_001963 [Pleurodeles waltl]
MSDLRVPPGARWWTVVDPGWACGALLRTGGAPATPGQCLIAETPGRTPRGGPRFVLTLAEPAAVRGRWCGAGSGHCLSRLTSGCVALVTGYSLGPFASTEAD